MTFASTQTCDLDGCNQPHEAKGYCRTHYNRLRRYGDPLKSPGLDKQKQTCEVEGCTFSHHARGYCQTHYSRWVKTGNAHRTVRPLTASKKPPSLPVQPLVDYVNARGGLGEVMDESGVVNRVNFRERENVRKNYDRAVERGEIPVVTADSLIIRLFGLHPYAVYGEDWWADSEDEPVGVAA